jgi:transposase
MSSPAPQEPDPRDQRIADLEREVAELKAIIDELKRKLEEAMRATKRQAAPFSKGEPKTHPAKRGRKPGADYGLKAHRDPPRRATEAYESELPGRCECGGAIEEIDVVKQYQEEIPREPIRRTFHVHRGRCLRCGRSHHGRHPYQTSDALGAAGAQLGANAQAVVAMLKNEVGASYGDIVKIFDRCWDIRITRGGATHIVTRVSDRLKAPYQGILTTIRRSRILDGDETGWKIGGHLQWLWVLVAKTATAYAIRDSRGHDVLEEILGRDWSGDIGHDGWAPYNWLTKATHQQCIGHIQRRCRDLLESAVRGAVRFPRAVLEFTKALFAVRDRRDAGEYSERGLATAIGRMEARLDELLEWRLSCEPNRRLRKHLAAHRDEWFVFLRKPWVEGTAWRADQAIRFAVANRKVFGGNRDDRGARALERFVSVWRTCLKRGVDAFTYITRVLCVPEERRDQTACRLLSLPAPP